MGLMQGKIKTLKNLLFGQINHESVLFTNNKKNNNFVDNNKNIGKTTETTKRVIGTYNRSTKPHMFFSPERRELNNPAKEPQPTNSVTIPQMFHRRSVIRL